MSNGPMYDFMDWCPPCDKDKSNRQRKRETRNLNTNLYFIIQSRFANLVYNLFEWSGHEESVDWLFLEKMLCHKGSGLFFFDSSYGYLVSDYIEGPKLNFYYKPTTREAISHNYRKKYTRENSVIISNTFDRHPTSFLIRDCAGRCMNALRQIDVHANALKTPVFVKGEKDTINNMEKTINEISENQPFVLMASDNPLASSTEVFQGAQHSFLADFWDTYHEYENIFLTAIGIQNGNQDKKERMITAEANSNNSYTYLNLMSMFDARQRSVDIINRKLGANISVKVKHEDDFAEELEKEGDEWLNTQSNSKT